MLWPCEGAPDIVVLLYAIAAPSSAIAAVYDVADPSSNNRDRIAESACEESCDMRSSQPSRPIESTGLVAITRDTYNRDRE